MQTLGATDKVLIRLSNGQQVEGKILEMSADSARVRLKQTTTHAAIEALIYAGIDETTFTPNEKNQWWSKGGDVIVRKIEE